MKVIEYLVCVATGVMVTAFVWLYWRLLQIDWSIFYP